MKKIILVLLSLLLLVGCSGKPSDVSDVAYKNGKNAIEYVDKYIDADMSIDDLIMRLNGLADFYSPDSDKYFSDEYVKNFIEMMQNSAESIKTYGNKYGANWFDNLVSERNSLARCVGLPEK